MYRDQNLLAKKLGQERRWDVKRFKVLRVVGMGTLGGLQDFLLFMRRQKFGFLHEIFHISQF